MYDEANVADLHPALVAGEVAQARDAGRVRGDAHATYWIAYGGVLGTGVARDSPLIPLHWRRVEAYLEAFQDGWDQGVEDALAYEANEVAMQEGDEAW